jgi:uncharacterized membrane protein
MTEAGSLIPGRSRGLAWLASAVALIGLGVSVLLLLQSLEAGASLPGCGGPGQGGCGAVLSSRWSHWLGLPLPYLALVGFGAALVSSAVLAVARQPVVRRTAAAIVWPVGLGAALAGAWFIYLQVGVVGQICPYCMVVDGSALALGVLAYLLVAGGGTSLLSVRATLVGALLAALGVTGLMAGQVLNRPETQVLKVAGQGIYLDRYPVLGNREASHQVLAIIDYTCPHCRELHGFLRQARQQYGNDLAVAIAPAPLDADCNPTKTQTRPQHADGCELAHLALAVWRAAPEQFPAMDRWLFASDSARSVDAARAKAAELVGPEALERTLNHDEPWRARFLAAQGRLNARLGEVKTGQGYPIGNTLPKLLLPGGNLIAGRPATAQALIQRLEATLASPPATAPAPSTP